MVVLLSSTKKIKSLLKMYWVVGAYHVFESKPTIRALLPTVLGKFGVTAVQLHRTVIFFLCFLWCLSSLPNFPVFWEDELA